MRYILGIDTASAHGSVALAADGAASEALPLHPGEHSSGLTAAVSALLVARGLSIGAMGALAVSKGPGSFTGLRIGLAWAKGAALAGNVPLVLVSAHEAAARAVGAARGSRLLATLVPGERGHVEAALWGVDPGAPPIRGPEPLPEGDAIERLAAAAAGGPLALAPSTSALAARLREELDGEDGSSDAPVIVIPPVPLGAAVAELGDRAFLAGEREDVVAAVPAYGRAPNARRPGA
jgi:tRNA threonylcarbamoyladenosine biosynthesis protein TsaB